MKYFLLMIFMIFLNNNLKSQIIINSDIIFRNNIRIDSIFEHFEYPKEPDTLKNYKSGKTNLIFVTATVAALVQVDKNNRVSNINLFPFYDIDNNFKYGDIIWSEIENSIIKASKKWIFKPVKFRIPEGMDSLETIKFKKVRPWGGSQVHIIIFSFHNGEFDTNDYFLSPIRIDDW